LREVQALKREGYVKASGVAVGDLSMEVKVRRTWRWKPWAESRVIVALKDFVVVVAAAITGGGGSFRERT
ncbi:UNVERIFIED_CONTAM: hypothetical protein Sindi_1839000, partial [Sesamum indicum]